jgi:hypothetical protein
MLDVGVWTQDFKNRLLTPVEDDDAFDAFILLLFAGNTIVSRDSISELIDLEKYLERLEARLASQSLDSAHPTVQVALKKAANRS